MRALLLVVASCVACSPVVSSGDGGAGGGSASAGGAATSAGGAATAGGAASAGGASAGGTATAGGSASAGGTSSAGGSASAGGTSAGGGPVVTRGGMFLGAPERFNRYYTDPTWQPTTTVYVSANGTGNGNSMATPSSVSAGLARAAPGVRLFFLSGTYSGCYELTDTQGGTPDNPVVLYAQRGANGARSVTINCCATGRATCINLEAANDVAVDGFELVGGSYGVRSVGAGYPAPQHQRGVAVLNNDGHGQSRDPFFTGQSDWYVIEKNVAHDVGTADGHGIYLSNGSDWNLVRFNETYNTSSADFQINADPQSTCVDDGVAVTTPECDAVAGTHATGGRGASDFMWVEGNFFHHSLRQSSNFTSVRNSVVINNVFGLAALHGVSFWQETANPNLGSRNNTVLHNLFITTNARQAVQFINSSTGNEFRNNVVVATMSTGIVLDTDMTTTTANTFSTNAWLGGIFDVEDTSTPYAPTAMDVRQATFTMSWFRAFSTTLGHDATIFQPAAGAPWLDKGTLAPRAPTDRAGRARTAPVDLGPYEL